MAARSTTTVLRPYHYDDYEDDNDLIIVLRGGCFRQGSKDIAENVEGWDTLYRKISKFFAEMQHLVNFHEH